MANLLIGSEVLDIGSRRLDRQQRSRQHGMMAESALTMGLPGQFDIPAVPDVSLWAIQEGSYTVVGNLKSLEYSPSVLSLSL
jgi:hypothetical protein